jgi:hypothetical protein
MTRKNLILLLFVLCFSTFGQQVQPKAYMDNITKAEQLHQAKDYKNSAFAYSTAFKNNDWKGTLDDRWNASCSWALAKYPDSAFFNLFRLAYIAKYTDVTRLKTDSNLNFLHVDNRWQTLLGVVQKNKDSLEVNLNKSVAKQLEIIFNEDQQYRLQLDEIEKSTTKSAQQKLREQEAIWNIIKKKDAINLAQVKAIIAKFGWLGRAEIGEQGNATLFLVIQHSDLATQEKYLPLMRDAVKKGKAQSGSLALLEDRVALGQGKKQIYGSQITKDNLTGQYMVSPIEDEINVNKRRAAVGLEPIEEYVKQWGIKYKTAAFDEKHIPISIRTSLIIITVIFVLLLILLLYLKLFNWFWLFFLACLLNYSGLYKDYSFGELSPLREFQGGWVFLSSSRFICEYLIAFGLILSLYKLFKLKHIIIDVIALFVAYLLYHYILIPPLQKLFLPVGFISFYFNIIEPFIYACAFGIITFIIYLIKKRKKQNTTS